MVGVGKSNVELRSKRDLASGTSSASGASASHEPSDTPKDEDDESTHLADWSIQSGGAKIGDGNGNFRSMRGERVKAFSRDLLRNTHFIDALVVMAGAFFPLLVFHFYPMIFIPILLALVGFVAYKSAPFGTILAAVVALPAIAYQSPLFAWLFLAILSTIMFKAFETWMIISLLFALVCCPFTPFGILLIPLHVIAALMLGSKKGAIVTAITIFSVLVLSVVWGVSNSGFVVYNHQLFQNIYSDNSAAFSQLKINTPAPSLGDFLNGSAIGAALSGFTNWAKISLLNEAINISWFVASVLLLADSGLLQILVWTASMFFIGFLPARVKWKRKNTIASLATVAVLNCIALASYLSQVPFDYVAIPSVILAIAFVWFLETEKIDISREMTVMKQEKQKKFSKFGLQDLSLAGSGETLKDVGGYESTKRELYDAVVLPLQRKELQTAYGISPPKGILLFGPPGTGKTMLMRALAKEISLGFYYVKCSDLLSQWYGETEQNIAELFKIARASAPCVLFFDEIDAIGKRRDAYTADDVTPRMLSVMLSEMDGLKTDKPVIIVGATNAPQALDPALMRPGRFDKVIYMPLPDKTSRKSIFKTHSRGLPLAEDVDFDELAKKTERYSGADIANIVHEAASRASKYGLRADRVVPIAMTDFRAVLDAIKPTSTLSQLDDYERFRVDYERRTDPEKKERKEKSVGWKDVIGMDDVREALLEAIEIPLLHEDLLKEYKVEPIKGILLFGPPGCGKTMIVKAAANELKSTFIAISGADLLKMGYDGAVNEIKNAFNRAKENPPSLIFIDEVDSVAPSREIAAATPLGEKLVAQILNEMDGVKELRSVLFIGATNRPEMVDSAMLRPGRFDKIIFIHPPLLEERARLFAVNLKEIPKADNIDVDELAKASDGFSGADITSICQEAKMRAIRKKIASGKKAEVTKKDLLDVISERRPSITQPMLESYIRFMREYGERR